MKKLIPLIFLLSTTSGQFGSKNKKEKVDPWSKDKYLSSERKQNKITENQHIEIFNMFDMNKDGFVDAQEMRITS